MYSVLNDTLNGIVDAAALRQEIEESSIVIQIDSVSTSDDDLDLVFAATLTAEQTTVADAVVAAHTGEPLDEPVVGIDVANIPPFASKKVTICGVEKNLFKRVHGTGAIITAGQSGNIDFTVPYTTAKFTGAELIGTERKDTLDFCVLDNQGVQLNQFGFDVEMPDGVYKNTSNYDSDISKDMVIRCVYKNNGTSDKYVAMNIWLHEVK